MAKRPFSEISEGTLDLSSNDAVNLLLDFSDELVSCIKTLKASTQATPSQLDIAKLSTLSSRLLPAFQSLAKEKVTTQTTAEKSSSNPPPQKIVRHTPSEVSTQPSKTRALEVPGYFHVTPWTSADLAGPLPELPPADQDLVEAAFTHSAVSPQFNYERLEWIGDAYLEIIASSFIFATFGRLKVGRCSQMRERLICNQTLSKYFKEYNFASRAKVPSHVSIHGASKDTIKVQGDMVEAFVAAVVLSDADHGVARVAKWLKALWVRMVEQEIRELERAPDLKKSQEMMRDAGAAQDDKVLSKVHLATAVKVPGVELEYEDMGPPKPDKNNKKLSLYTVGVFLTGWGEKKKLLGTGMAHSKKEAGQKAAHMALENKKLIKIYREKKNLFLASRDAGSGSDKPH